MAEGGQWGRRERCCFKVISWYSSQNDSSLIKHYFWYFLKIDKELEFDFTPTSASNALGYTIRMEEGKVFIVHILSILCYSPHWITLEASSDLYVLFSLVVWTDFFVHVCFWTQIIWSVIAFWGLVLGLPASLPTKYKNAVQSGFLDLQVFAFMMSKMVVHRSSSFLCCSFWGLPLNTLDSDWMMLPQWFL